MREADATEQRHACGPRPLKATVPVNHVSRHAQEHLDSAEAFECPAPGVINVMETAEISKI